MLAKQVLEPLLQPSISFFLMKTFSHVIKQNLTTITMRV
jgi:hypothetical protein